MSDNPWIARAAGGVASLKPYQPGKPLSDLEREYGIVDAVKLASNENPLGPSPAAMAAMQAEGPELARYPDGGGHALKAALSAKHAVDPACITLGNGSNDVLDMIARVFLSEGRGSLFSQHAFAVYPIATLAVGATIQMATAKNYGHDLDAMAATMDDSTSVVWIANPNNPTGTWLKAAELETYMASLPAHVVCVLDEAYVEYVDHPDYPDGAAWLDRFPNLIVTRTFSKAYGLAALRVGYALSSPEIADLLNRVRQPFNVNSAAMAAAVAALADQDHIARGVALNREGMAWYEAEFQRLGLDYIPSVGNFITVHLGQSGDAVYERLLREGVITRPVTPYGMPDHLRISIGTMDENRRCTAALEQVL